MIYCKICLKLNDFCLWLLIFNHILSLFSVSILCSDLSSNMAHAVLILNFRPTMLPSDDVFNADAVRSSSE
jgi:hypothetical protein